MTPDVTDLLDEIAEQQHRAERILMELVQRLSRVETRLCTFIEATGHGHVIASTNQQRGTV